jgi:hypothetical protein
VLPYPDWLDFHTRSIAGPVVSLRSRSGVVRLEAGEREAVERVVVGIPDDDAWRALTRTLDSAGFWQWADNTSHSEPHRPADWYWWLEVRHDGREHRAAAWNGAPDGLELVRNALFQLVEQVEV